MDRSPDASPHGIWAQLLGGGVVAAAVLACSTLYPAAFGADVHPRGPDMFEYIWQTRLVGAGPLAEVGTRPGMPVLGSVLSGFHAVPVADAPLILGLVLAIALGLAVAVALRLAFRLPPWSLGVVAFAIALWGGALHLSKGYLANELSLVCFVVATLLVALPGGHDLARVLGGFMAATAAGFAHPGLLPFYAAVDGAWLVLSLPRIIGDRHADRRWWEEAPVRSLVILAAAAGVTSLVIFGVMALRVSDVTNLTAGIREFTRKLAEVRVSIGLWVTAVPVLAAAGVIAAWRLRRPSARDLTRVGLAWGLCSVGGALATMVRPTLPGHRALLIILPLPAAAGLGSVWMAWALVRAGRRPRGAEAGPRPVLAAAGVLAAVGVVVVSCALLAAPGLARLSKHGVEPVRGDPARLVASYVATVEPTTPVVVFSRPTAERAALSWKGRQNQVRAYVPTSSIASTFVVVGVLGGPEATTPEPIHDVGGIGTGFLYASEQSWIEGGPALREGAVVVAPQAYNDPSVWAAISADPSRVVSPGLAVLRGPRTAPDVANAPAAVPQGEATLRALACLLVLAALGWGFAAAGAHALDATALDAVALAPAFGAVLTVLTGLVVGVPGGDPAGPVGLAAVAGVAGVGYVLAWRARAGVRAGATPTEPVP